MESFFTAKKLVGHFGEVNSIAMSAHGDIFATGANRHQGIEGRVRIWDSHSGKQIGEIDTDLNSIFGLAISPDGRSLAAGGGGAVFGMRWEYTGGVEVWSLEKKQRLTRFGEEELFFVKSIAFSPDGNMLLTSSSPKPPIRPRSDYERIRLWRTSDFKKIVALGEEESDVASASFSPNGRFVAFAANPASAGVRAPTGLLATLRRQNFIPPLLRKERANIYLHDARSMTPLIRIWNALGQHEERALELPKGRVKGLAFSLDGRTLASCGSSLVIWDFTGRTVITEFAQVSSSSSVAFSPDGGILASGGGYRSEPGGPYQDCGVKLWDSKSGRLIAFLPHEKPVHSLAFLPDGLRIVAGGESGELLMWNISSGSQARDLYPS
jgi:WD40 repeat protein